MLHLEIKCGKVLHIAQLCGKNGNSGGKNANKSDSECHEHLYHLRTIRNNIIAVRSAVFCSLLYPFLGTFSLTTSKKSQTSSYFVICIFTTLYIFFWFLFRSGVRGIFCPSHPSNLSINSAIWSFIRVHFVNDCSSFRE